MNVGVHVVNNGVIYFIVGTVISCLLCLNINKYIYIYKYIYIFVCVHIYKYIHIYI